jgi:hypothetical protein
MLTHVLFHFIFSPRRCFRRPCFYKSSYWMNFSLSSPVK